MSTCTASTAAGSSTVECYVDPEIINDILDKYSTAPDSLISILGEIQDLYRYLPETALRMVAKETGRSLVDVYGVATFYHSFSLKPKGKHEISVCLGTACHVRGGPKVAAEFERVLGICAGDTTPDMEFTLTTVNCLGACALGPIVVVDGEYHSKVEISQVAQIVKDVQISSESESPVEIEDMELLYVDDSAALL